MRRGALILLGVVLAGALLLRVTDQAPVEPAPSAAAPAAPQAAATLSPAPAALTARAPAEDEADAGRLPPDAGPEGLAPAPGLTALTEAMTEALQPDAGAPLPADAPTVTSDAGRPRTRDARFGVRWGEPGLCGEEPRAALAQRRAALLSTFASVQRAQTLVFFDPAVPVSVADGVGTSLLEARAILLRLLGPRADVPFPEVLIYESAAQLRSVACVNTATAGYYDGAIHLPADDPDVHRTVVHELTHHVLNVLGVRKPMWFHEGLAMYAADERWWEDPRSGLVPWLRREHLPFGALVEAFPHTADELFAGAVYYQSFQMVRFVGARAGRPDFGWLVDELASGRLDAQVAFADGLGLADGPLEDDWRRFIAAGP